MTEPRDDDQLAGAHLAADVLKDLGAIPTRILLDVLKARFDFLIFVGDQDQGERGSEWIATWKGHAIRCEGMAIDLVRSIQDWRRGGAVDDGDHPDDDGDADQESSAVEDP